MHWLETSALSVLMKQWRGETAGHKKRPTFIKYLARQAAVRMPVKMRAEKFVKDNKWLGDLRSQVTGLPLGRIWLRITDREGNVISTEMRASDLDHLLDVCQDQWDIAQQLISRLLGLTEQQFTTCRVLYRDGMPIDTAIEAARRL